MNGREVATEQAKAYPELQEYVTQYLKNREAPSPKEEDWEKQRTEKQQKYQQEKEQAKQARHKNFKDIQDNIKNGTHLYALYDIARVYLGYPFRDINHKLPTLERVAEYSGKNMVSVVLEGIRICIEQKKHIMPSAKDIILSKIQGKVYYIQPIIIVYCHLYMQEHDTLQGLDLEFLKSTLAACDWGVYLMLGNGEILPHLKEELENIIFVNKKNKEDFIRDVIEPSLEHKTNDIHELTILSREPRFFDIAGDLALEWLGKYELSNMSLHHILSVLICDKPDNLISLIRQNINNEDDDAERYGMWMGVAFLVAFEEYSAVLTQYAKENKDFLWRIRNLSFPDRYGDDSLRNKLPILTVQQNAFIIKSFSSLWQSEESPSSSWSGNNNPWDATDFIRGRIRNLSEDTSPEAIECLQKLSENPECISYHNTLKHALHEQKQKQIDEEVKTRKISLEDVRAILLHGEPINHKDFQEILMKCLEDLQRRINGSHTDIIEIFWDKDKPFNENQCRNRIIEHLEGALGSFKISADREVDTCNNKRCDILYTHSLGKLPIEIKGQWHNKLWVALNEQVPYYTKDYRTEGYGIYLVLWFGNNIKTKKPKAYNRKRPRNYQEMKNQFQEIYPNLSEKIKIFILNLEKS